MSEQRKLPVEKSEILFFYETTYSTPNGDPFTGEQRYDEETKKVLVSDVRIKRFIRDYFIAIGGYDVYVFNDRSSVEEGKKISGAAARMQSLKKKYNDVDKHPDVYVEVGKGEKKKKEQDALKVMQKCIDVRLFGGISTEEGDAVNLTGPVQYSLLNPSLNSVDLRMHQNTSVFSSSTEKSRGAIGTTTVVPYAINQIHGWINPYSALHTCLSEEDIKLMFKALWESINNANTRTKQNQNSLLLLQIVYAEPTKKLYGADRLVKLNTLKATEEQIRSSEDYTLDFGKIHEAAQKEIVKEIRFYTQVDAIKSQLQGKKIKAITL
ncbi:type I-B CRISPR-associated protein Cas7/Csh2 [Prosthecochloris sp. N3]|uniref:Type I-B CRISPR-associated protein Cas7/Csh2 n=1 Tax=Prosthecochloris ethylica TaxID=2743976 RepID=A0ABR9XT49_9CHLB|nr:type I-B CRISPR-associated protein Cas7/Csh2 [Prosthecochloris ethylica]MBF0586690.1 type I-B CRISPR-associated protein Cas7/Csh2 [Prosthecochloris ethylica]MBF0636956.1 type I-B CRISPR-associated protein Cas7/Csh2 [Prosthecochloris ethylica]NUK47827.1 type I-B CRISPR-associated protein Cas7/Csh2 [Prosthecochloris ethylica]